MWGTRGGKVGCASEAKGPVRTLLKADYAVEDFPVSYVDHMKIEAQGDTVRVFGFNELGAGNATAFRDQVRSALADDRRNIDVDLSETSFVDSSGLGALIALHKSACNRKGVLRLLNPKPAVQQILELTRMHRLFEIVKS